MPGTNLTREEAQQRAKLLTVDSYEIDLDLSGAQEGGTYRSVTTVRSDVEDGGTSRSSEAETGEARRPSSTWSLPPFTR